MMIYITLEKSDLARATNLLASKKIQFGVEYFSSKEKSMIQNYAGIMREFNAGRPKDYLMTDEQFFKELNA